MNEDTSPSFSFGRKWLFSLNMLLTLGAVVALLVMVNYLAARHFRRWDWSASSRFELSPLTERVLREVTNEVKVTVYFDKENSLYPSVWALLKEYNFRNSRLRIETVDYEREPGAATALKARYKFGGATEKDLVIFDCQGRTRFVEEKQLSDLDLNPLISGQSREVRRTHFRGEMEFTSAILSVTSARSLKAYFLQGHGEHRFDSSDGLTGYADFAALLRENNIACEVLNLSGASDVPADCSLLIVAGPSDPLFPAEVEKIARYLNQGGRMFALFSYTSLNKQTGLEALLANWGVTVGNNIVRESEEHRLRVDDVVIFRYNTHAITKPFYKSQLYMVRPRSIAKAAESGGADAPQVEVLAVTSEEARVVSDIRADGLAYPRPNDFVGTVPLMVAVEKGSLPGVGATRGSARLVVAGESIFLGNQTIKQAANRDFAGHIVNWLLARNELLGTLGPRPIKEYRLLMTSGQLATARWTLMAGLPGAVLLVGSFVWLRRRR